MAIARSTSSVNEGHRISSQVYVECFKCKVRSASGMLMVDKNEKII